VNVVLTIADYLIILALLGLIIVLAVLITAVLKLKSGAISDAKRLYERPLQSFKNLAAAGKGIVQQETVHIDAISARAKSAGVVVNEVAEDLNEAITTIRDVDWESLIASAQGFIKFASAAAGVARAVTRQSRN
jgi:hypothetical protein